MEKLIVVPDTHGQLDHVQILLSFCEKQGYTKDHKLAFLGDYVDRGPKVKGLIEKFIELKKQGHIFICGNHDYVMKMILDEKNPRFDYWVDRWWRNFESQTLKSYGVQSPQLMSSIDEWKEAARQLKDKMPPAHIDFFFNLPLFYENDDLILIHAGLNPQVSWEEQKQALLNNDKKSQRGPEQLFSAKLAKNLSHQADKKVISGHTVVKSPVIRAKRILLHTGVDYYGVLTIWVSSKNKIFRIFRKK